MAVVEQTDEEALFEQWELELEEYAKGQTVTPGGEPLPSNPPTVPTEVPDVATPAWVPTPGPPQVFNGNTPLAQWEDVYEVTNGHILAQVGDLNAPVSVTGPQVQHAASVTAGETIKSLSGFINNLSDYTTGAVNAVTQQVNANAEESYAISIDHEARIEHLESVMNFVVSYVVPDLQAQIHNLTAAMNAQNAAQGKALQTWSIDHIYDPLNDKIGQVQANATSQVDALRSDVPNIVRQVVPTLGLATAASLAPIAAQVATLTIEDTECVQPMCETMGPNTNLGKLLKALSLAADAALITELLGMKVSDLVTLIQTLAAKFGSVVGEFETFFTDGTETIGETLTNALGL